MVHARVMGWHDWSLGELHGMFTVSLGIKGESQKNYKELRSRKLVCLHLPLSLTLVSQFIGNMSKGRTSGYTPDSSTRTAAPTIWWMLHCDSRQCGVAVANSSPRHGRPPDGRGGVKTSHQSVSAIWPLRGVLAEATIERSII